MVYKLEALSEKTGVSRRAIRYYIQRGLLPPPEGKLKGAYYTEEHLKRLNEINLLSERGVPLAQMKPFFEGEAPIEEVVLDECRAKEDCLELAQSTWIRYEVEPGVELNVREGTVDSKKINKILTFIKDNLK
jgi:DNA-binding transcriptional MerR regulator